ncbi:SDR family NAD(P)-dependent oxidoreductase [Hypericibacter sp.]|uniref:SDR family NAD(P)-dependent oxidoreductase n=1 Tax=Hypericibacter sp. TaxID=2705401 RepID=UPI003D6C9908
MQIDLAGKHALVTGGTTGIGFAAAKALAEAGARVMITGQNADRVRNAASQLGPHALGVVADNRSVDAIARVAAQARDVFGKLDILVANAGVTWSAPIEQVSEADFDAQMAINFRGSFFAVQKCLPLMGRGGSIVMTSSCLDAKGIPGMAVYSASKAAVRSLVRTLAAELAARGIRVNSVAPGPIDTPIYDKLGLSPADADKVRNEEAQATIMKRLGAPSEVGQAILFLASDAASYVTGANLRVDGGWTDI